MRQCRTVCDVIHTNKMLDGTAYMFAIKGVQGHIQLLRKILPILNIKSLGSMHPDHVRDAQIFITIYNRLYKIDANKSELLTYSNFLDDMEKEIKDNIINT